MIKKNIDMKENIIIQPDFNYIGYINKYTLKNQYKVCDRITMNK